MLSIYLSVFVAVSHSMFGYSFDILFDPIQPERLGKACVYVYVEEPVLGTGLFDEKELRQVASHFRFRVLIRGESMSRYLFEALSAMSETFLGNTPKVLCVTVKTDFSSGHLFNGLVTFTSILDLYSQKHRPHTPDAL